MKFFYTLPALEPKMKRQTKQLREQFAKGKRLEDEIQKNLKGLGHDI